MTAMFDDQDFLILLVHSGSIEIGASTDMTFKTEAHGRYEIKSGPSSGAWAANAFLHKTIVAKASGVSRERVVADVKSQLDCLDQLDHAGRDDEGAPAAEIYERAFARLIPDMPASYQAMLKAHLGAPDQLISATKLADAAGYAGYEGANLHYGKLAQRVAEEIGFVPPKRTNGTDMWTCAIARGPGIDNKDPDPSMLEGISRTSDSPHFQWQMRQQVTQALRALSF